MKKSTRFLLILLIIVVVTAGAFAGAYFLAASKADKNGAEVIPLTPEQKRVIVFNEAIADAQTQVKSTGYDLSIPDDVDPVYNTRYVTAVDVVDVFDNYVVYNVDDKILFSTRDEENRLIAFDSAISFNSVLKMYSNYALVRNGNDLPFVVDLKTRQVVVNSESLGFNPSNDELESVSFVGDFLVYEKYNAINDIYLNGAFETNYVIKVFYLKDSLNKLVLSFDPDYSVANWQESFQDSYVFNFEQKGNLLIVQTLKSNFVFALDVDQISNLNKLIPVVGANEYRNNLSLLASFTGTEEYDIGIIANEQVFRFLIVNKYNLSYIDDETIFIENLIGGGTQDNYLTSKNVYIYSDSGNYLGQKQLLFTQHCYIRDLRQNGLTTELNESGEKFIELNGSDFSGHIFVVKSNADGTQKTACYISSITCDEVLNYDYSMYGKVVARYGDNYVTIAENGLSLRVYLINLNGETVKIGNNDFINNVNYDKVFGDKIVYKSGTNNAGVIDLAGNQSLTLNNVQNVSPVVDNVVFYKDSQNKITLKNLVTGERVTDIKLLSSMENYLFSRGADVYVTTSGGQYSIYSVADSQTPIEDDVTIIDVKVEDDILKIIYLDADNNVKIIISNDCKMEHSSTVALNNSFYEYANTLNAVLASSAECNVVRAEQTSDMFSLGTLISTGDAVEEYNDSFGGAVYSWSVDFNDEYSIDLAGLAMANWNFAEANRVMNGLGTPYWDKENHKYDSSLYVFGGSGSYAVDVTTNKILKVNGIDAVECSIKLGITYTIDTENGHFYNYSDYEVFYDVICAYQLKKFELKILDDFEGYSFGLGDATAFNAISVIAATTDEYAVALSDLLNLTNNQVNARELQLSSSGFSFEPTTFIIGGAENLYYRDMFVYQNITSGEWECTKDGLGFLPHTTYSKGLCTNFKVTIGNVGYGETIKIAEEIPNSWSSGSDSATYIQPVVTKTYTKMYNAIQSSKTHIGQATIRLQAVNFSNSNNNNLIDKFADFTYLKDGRKWTAFIDANNGFYVANNVSYNSDNKYGTTYLKHFPTKSSSFLSDVYRYKFYEAYTDVGLVDEYSFDYIENGVTKTKEGTYNVLNLVLANDLQDIFEDIGSASLTEREKQEIISGLAFITYRDAHNRDVEIKWDKNKPEDDVNKTTFLSKFMIIDENHTETTENISKDYKIRIYSGGSQLLTANNGANSGYSYYLVDNEGNILQGSDGHSQLAFQDSPYYNYVASGTAGQYGMIKTDFDETSFRTERPTNGFRFEVKKAGYKVTGLSTTLYDEYQETFESLLPNYIGQIDMGEFIDNILNVLEQFLISKIYVYNESGFLVTSSENTNLFTLSGSKVAKNNDFNRQNQAVNIQPSTIVPLYQLFINSHKQLDNGITFGHDLDGIVGNVKNNGSSDVTLLYDSPYKKVLIVNTDSTTGETSFSYSSFMHNEMLASNLKIDFKEIDYQAIFYAEQENFGDTALVGSAGSTWFYQEEMDDAVKFVADSPMIMKDGQEVELFYPADVNSVEGLNQLYYNFGSLVLGHQLYEYGKATPVEEPKVVEAVLSQNSGISFNKQLMVLPYAVKAGYDFVGWLPMKEVYSYYIGDVEYEYRGNNDEALGRIVPLDSDVDITTSSGLADVINNKDIYLLLPGQRLTALKCDVFNKDCKLIYMAIFKPKEYTVTIIYDYQNDGNTILYDNNYWESSSDIWDQQNPIIYEQSYWDFEEKVGDKQVARLNIDSTNQKVEATFVFTLDDLKMAGSDGVFVPENRELNYRNVNLVLGSIGDTSAEEYMPIFGCLYVKNIPVDVYPYKEDRNDYAEEPAIIYQKLRQINANSNLVESFDIAKFIAESAEMMTQYAFDSEDALVVRKADTTDATYYLNSIDKGSIYAETNFTFYAVQSINEYQIKISVDNSNNDDTKLVFSRAFERRIERMNHATIDDINDGQTKIISMPGGNVLRLTQVKTTNPEKVLKHVTVDVYMDEGTNFARLIYDLNYRGDTLVGIELSDDSSWNGNYLHCLTTDEDYKKVANILGITELNPGESFKDILVDYIIDYQNGAFSFWGYVNHGNNQDELGVTDGYSIDYVYDNDYITNKSYYLNNDDPIYVIKNVGSVTRRAINIVLKYDIPEYNIYVSAKESTDYLTAIEAAKTANKLSGYNIETTNTTTNGGFLSFSGKDANDGDIAVGNGGDSSHAVADYVYSYQQNYKQFAITFTGAYTLINNTNNNLVYTHIPTNLYVGNLDFGLDNLGHYKYKDELVSEASITLEWKVENGNFLVKKLEDGNYINLAESTNGFECQLRNGEHYIVVITQRRLDNTLVKLDIRVEFTPDGENNDKQYFTGDKFLLVSFDELKETNYKAMAHFDDVSDNEENMIVVQDATEKEFIVSHGSYEPTTFEAPAYSNYYLKGVKISYYDVEKQEIFVANPYYTKSTTDNFDLLFGLSREDNVVGNYIKGTLIPTHILNAAGTNVDNLSNKIPFYKFNIKIEGIYGLIQIDLYYESIAIINVTDAIVEYDGTNGSELDYIFSFQNIVYNESNEVISQTDIGITTANNFSGLDISNISPDSSIVQFAHGVSYYTTHEGFVLSGEETEADTNRQDNMTCFVFIGLMGGYYSNIKVVAQINDDYFDYVSIVSPNAEHSAEDRKVIHTFNATSGFVNKLTISLEKCVINQSFAFDAGYFDDSNKWVSYTGATYYSSGIKEFLDNRFGDVSLKLYGIKSNPVNEGIVYNPSIHTILTQVSGGMFYYGSNFQFQSYYTLDSTSGRLLFMPYIKLVINDVEHVFTYVDGLYQTEFTEDVASEGYEKAVLSISTETNLITIRFVAKEFNIVYKPNYAGTSVTWDWDKDITFIINGEEHHIDLDGNDENGEPVKISYHFDEIIDSAQNSVLSAGVAGYYFKGWALENIVDTSVYSSVLGLHANNEIDGQKLGVTFIYQGFPILHNDEIGYLNLGDTNYLSNSYKESVGGNILIQYPENGEINAYAVWQIMPVGVTIHINDARENNGSTNADGWGDIAVRTLYYDYGDYVVKNIGGDATLTPFVGNILVPTRLGYSSPIAFSKIQILAVRMVAGGGDPVDQNELIDLTDLRAITDDGNPIEVWFVWQPNSYVITYTLNADVDDYFTDDAILTFGDIYIGYPTYSTINESEATIRMYFDFEIIYPVVECVGYNFKGWFNQGEDKEISAGSTLDNTFVQAENTALYFFAQWEIQGVKVVVIDSPEALNHASNGVLSIYYNNQNYINNFKALNGSDIKWIDKDYNGESYGVAVKNIKTTDSSNVWDKYDIGTINYHFMIGYSSLSGSVKLWSDDIAQASDLTKKASSLGYTFKGYYYLDNGEFIKYFDNNGNMVHNWFITWDNSNPIVLYAKWEINEYDIELKLPTGSYYTQLFSPSTTGYQTSPNGISWADNNLETALENTLRITWKVYKESSEANNSSFEEVNSGLIMNNATKVKVKFYERLVFESDHMLEGHYLYSVANDGNEQIFTYKSDENGFYYNGSNNEMIWPVETSGNLDYLDVNFGEYMTKTSGLSGFQDFTISLDRVLTNKSIDLNFDRQRFQITIVGVYFDKTGSTILTRRTLTNVENCPYYMSININAMVDAQPFYERETGLFKDANCSEMFNNYNSKLITDLVVYVKYLSTEKASHEAVFHEYHTGVGYKPVNTGKNYVVATTSNGLSLYESVYDWSDCISGSMILELPIVTSFYWPAEIDGKTEGIEFLYWIRLNPNNSKDSSLITYIGSNKNVLTPNVILEFMSTNNVLERKVQVGDVINANDNYYAVYDVEDKSAYVTAEVVGNANPYQDEYVIYKLDNNFYKSLEFIFPKQEDDSINSFNYTDGVKLIATSAGRSLAITLDKDLFTQISKGSNYSITNMKCVLSAEKIGQIWQALGGGTSISFEFEFNTGLEIVNSQKYTIKHCVASGQNVQSVRTDYVLLKTDLNVSISKTELTPQGNVVKEQTAPEDKTYEVRRGESYTRINGDLYTSFNVKYWLKLEGAQINGISWNDPSRGGTYWEIEGPSIIFKNANNVPDSSISGNTVSSFIKQKGLKNSLHIGDLNLYTYRSLSEYYQIGYDDNRYVYYDMIDVDGHKAHSESNQSRIDALKSQGFRAEEISNGTKLTRRLYNNYYYIVYKLTPIGE